MTVMPGRKGSNEIMIATVFLEFRIYEEFSKFLVHNEGKVLFILCTVFQVRRRDQSFNLFS